MAKLRVGTLRQTRRSWKETIVDRIHSGKVLPIVSNAVCDGLAFGSHSELVEGWAEFIGYTSPDRRNLTRMTQYQSVMSKADPEIRADDRYIKEVYLDFLRKVLCSIADQELREDLEEDPNLDALTPSDIAERLNCPPFDDGMANPLLLLAELPLPIYLTTSYHKFVEIALERAGRTPRTEICYWDNSLASIPSVFKLDTSYTPSKEEPLVYHLFGLDAYPNSLVLTEDDHLDFLVAISGQPESIPPRVRQALTDSSLVLLGYGLREWDFRVLFRGIIKTSVNQRRPKSVFIQLLESREEANYLESYLRQEAEFEVYWGSAQAFMQELWQGWAR